MRKIISTILFVCAISLSLSAQSFHGKRLAVPEPTFQNCPNDEKWIPIFVQGQLTTVLQNYTDKAGVKLLDRSNITQCIKEQKFSEKAFIEESTQLEVGKLVAANYIVSISILKKKSTYAVDCRINNAETGEAVGKAFRNPNCTAEYLEDGNLINDMGYALLLGLGVSERELSALKSETSTPQISKEEKQVISDNTNLAKGISVEREGGSVQQVAAYYNEISIDSALSGEALWRMGKKYYNGDGVSTDYARAVEYYRKAAEAGYAGAQNDLGFCYYEGKGVEKNYRTAVYWFEKAASQGNTWGQNNLGSCYLNGHGVERDYDKAFDLINKSIEQGNTHALVTLGNYYKNINGDYIKAFELYKKSADKNDETGIASLGICYYYGLGTVKDYSKAFECFEKAAKQGNSAAQVWTGLCYKNGSGTGKNFEQAVEWYKKAAEQGEAYGQNNLGICYYNGEGVKKDYKKAFYWWSKAAEQELPDAQDWLGTCYYNGIGVQRDSDKAFYWASKAAEQGVAHAQYLVGICYYYGKGTKMNQEMGISWWKKAAEQGDASSKAELRKRGR